MRNTRSALTCVYEVWCSNIHLVHFTLCESVIISTQRFTVKLVSYIDRVAQFAES